MTTHVNPWNETTVSALKELYKDGWSFSAIAKEINKLHGTKLTRNSTIGKVHRLGLTLRRHQLNAHARAPKTPKLPRKSFWMAVNTLAAANRADAAARKKPVRELIAIAQKFSAPPLPQLDGSLVNVLSLTDRLCSWMDGDPTEAGAAFCGRPVKLGSHYCAGHHERCYRPTDQRLAKAMAKNVMRLPNYALDVGHTKCGI